MHLAEALYAVTDMIRTQRLRAAIIVLCTAAGVAFLVGIVAIVSGLGTQLERDVLGKLYGFNTVQVRAVGAAAKAGAPESVERGRKPGQALTIADADWLATRLTVDGVLSYNYTGSGRISMAGAVNGQRLTAQILAASATHFAVQSLDVQRGRPFTEYEAQRGGTVTVLGSEVARRLFGRRDPLNHVVNVQGLPFRVIGVLEQRGKFLGFSMDNLVVVPAHSRLNGVINRRDEVDAISFRVPHDSLLAGATAAMEGEMRVRHRVPAADSSDFEITSSAMLLDGWRRIRRIMLIAGPALTSVALIVSVLVTMNIMLVVVTERVPEIGVRLAMGARRVDILTQFLAESITLSAVGGSLGVAAGMAAATALRVYAAVPTQVSLGAVAAGLLVSAAVGVGAGAYPAYRASLLTPIEALGRE